MEQYIPKSTLVVEIERLTEVNPIDEIQPQVQNKIDWLSGKFFVINSLRVFLDTIEVKDINLEKELETWRHNHFHGRRDKEASGEYLERVSQLNLAKHFFELGLKAQKGE